MCAAKNRGEDKQRTAEVVLRNFIVSALDKTEHSKQNYIRIVNSIDPKSSSSPEALGRWFRALAKCVTYLKPGMYPELMKNIYGFNWALPQKTVDAYQEFSLQLISSNIEFATPLFRALTKWIFPREKRVEEYCKMAEEDRDALFTSTHNLIGRIMKISPCSTSTLFPVLRRAFPHYRHSSVCQQICMKNLLRISEYVPQLRDQILPLLLEKMITIDDQILQVDYAKYEDQIMDDEQGKCKKRKVAEGDKVKVKTDEQKGDAKNEKATDEMVEKLDHMMTLMINYLSLIRDSNDKKLATDVFIDLLRAFFSSILPTHNSKHTQFLLFYMCSFDFGFGEKFLRLLVDKMCDTVGTGLILRQYCAAYASSFITRANYLRHADAWSSFDILLAYAEHLAETYQGSSTSLSMFYSACQAIFHILVHRRETFLPIITDSDEHVERLQNVLYCELDPVGHVNPRVAQYFLIVARQDGLLKPNCPLRADCITNRTEKDDMWEFFPFSPYLLKHSSLKINHLYRAWSWTHSVILKSPEGKKHKLEEFPKSEKNEFLHLSKSEGVEVSKSEYPSECLNSVDSSHRSQSIEKDSQEVTKRPKMHEITKLFPCQSPSSCAKETMSPLNPPLFVLRQSSLN